MQRCMLQSLTIVWAEGLTLGRKFQHCNSVKQYTPQKDYEMKLGNIPRNGKGHGHAPYYLLLAGSIQETSQTKHRHTSPKCNEYKTVTLKIDPSDNKLKKQKNKKFKKGHKKYSNEEIVAMIVQPATKFLDASYEASHRWLSMHHAKTCHT